MSKLRIIDNLTIAKEIDGVALQASLVCDCKSEYFYVLHTGKQTKGILRPLLAKNKKQISIVCRCKNCGKGFKVYDSTIDGLKPLNVEKTHYVSFALKNKDVFRISLYYNYLKENYMTDQFVDCFIHATDEENKMFVLFE